MLKNRIGLIRYPRRCDIFISPICKLSTSGLDSVRELPLRNYDVLERFVRFINSGRTTLAYAKRGLRIEVLARHPEWGGNGAIFRTRRTFPDDSRRDGKLNRKRDREDSFLPL